MRHPIAFIATSDPHAVEAFYSETLGLTLVERSPHALVYDDHGQTLRVQIVSGYAPPPYTAHGWHVADISSEMAKLRARGVEFLHFDALPQDEAGIWTTPDGSQIAWFADPSGTLLSLTQYADQARK